MSTPNERKEVDGADRSQNKAELLLRGVETFRIFMTSSVTFVILLYAVRPSTPSTLSTNYRSRPFVQGAGSECQENTIGKLFRYA